MKMKKWVVCYYCQGNGWFRDEKGALITCPECHGSGAWVEEVEEEEEKEKEEKEEEKD